MPLNCPNYWLEYNACLSCRSRVDNRCCFSTNSPRKLSDILTVEERVSILEDKGGVPPVDIVTISRADYQQLQRLLLLLEEKINKHIEKTPRRKYKHYTT